MTFLSRRSRLSLAGIPCHQSRSFPAFAAMTIASLVLLSACVPVPPELLPRTQQGGQPAASSYPDVESTGVSYNSVHFALRGYSETQLQSLANNAEDLFNQIGLETGLSSFMAGQTYTIVLYKDVSEFQAKTKLTDLRAVAAGNTVYTYPAADLSAQLAHYLMHMIFQSYMRDRTTGLSWLDEGMAMVMEVSRMPESARVRLRATQSSKLRTERMPLSQMTLYAGSSEPRRHEEAWYLQTESVVSYLLQQGTPLTFAAFLNALRNGAELDQALANAYPGRFRSSADLEMGWQASL